MEAEEEQHEEQETIGIQRSRRIEEGFSFFSEEFIRYKAHNVMKDI
jgi:hypothetical protein